jgi:hypothetical protein
LVSRMPHSPIFPPSSLATLLEQYPSHSRYSINPHQMKYIRNKPAHREYREIWRELTCSFSW